MEITFVSGNPETEINYKIRKHRLRFLSYLLCCFLFALVSSLISNINHHHVFISLKNQSIKYMDTMMNKLRSIEVTIISAEDLRLNRCPIKKNAIVTVQTDPPNNCYQSTTIDKDGGSYPYWNEKLYLQLSHDVKFLHVEVQCKTGLGVRLVGIANIPVSDFIGDQIPPYYLHFLSYRLKERNGERNGIVNLSLRVKQPQECVGKSLQYPSSVAVVDQASNNKNYNCSGVSMEKNYRGGEIAVGIPVASYGVATFGV